MILDGESLDDLRLSPWYLNTRRIAAATAHEISVNAQTPIARQSTERAAAMSFAGRIAQDMVLSGKIPNLLSLPERARTGRVLAAVWSTFTFSGMPAAFRADAEGKSQLQARFRGEIALGSKDCRISGSLYTDHVYSISAVGYLSGKKRVYVAGHFDFDKADRAIEVSPIIIGEFTTEFCSPSLLTNRWPRHARIYPEQIDCFRPIRDVRAPKLDQLTALRDIPEAEVKKHIAEIVGEPFVPIDWAGEKSDLYTSRVTVDGRPVSAAFLLKGPAKFAPMHPADLGRRGDQIPRLFDEPAELLVLQHCHKIMPTVVRQMEAFAVHPSRPRLYCIIDGADTYRILSGIAKCKLKATSTT